jgi:hypothetical protein
MDVTKVSKTINAPAKFVYEWCTDFSEDDPKITGSSSKRIIVEKTKKKAIYVVNYTGSDGKQKTNVNIVSLNPAKSWHLDQFGQEDNETGDYKITSLGKNKTRLDMTFKEKWKDIAKIPSIKEQRDGTEEFWDKLVSALEKDFANSHRQ